MNREDLPALAIVSATILGCIAAAVSIASEDAADRKSTRLNSSH